MRQVDANHKDFWRSVEKVDAHRDAEGTPVMVVVGFTIAVVFLFMLWHKGPEFWKSK